MHLFGDTKDVLFIVLNINKLLLFCIYISCVNAILCFPFCNYFTLHPPAFHKFQNLLFSDISFLNFSFHHHLCFLHVSFFVHLQIFSVADSEPCFNLDQILSTCLHLVSFISPVKISQNYRKDQLVGASIHVVLVQMPIFLQLLHHRQLVYPGLHTLHLV